MSRRANPSWVIQLEVVAEHLPCDNPNRVRLLITKDVAKEIIEELRVVLDRA